MNNYDAIFTGKCKQPAHHTCGCDSVKGNSIGVEIAKGDCEVRADVIVGRINTVRIWGRVKDCDGNSVGYALVKLARVINTCGVIDVEGVAHTVTDCNGFYQFDVPNCEVGTKYRIFVHKAATGCERRISESNLACNPCATVEPPYHPMPPCSQSPCDDD